MMPSRSTYSAVDWVLRFACLGVFAGHGVLAFAGRPDWLVFLTWWGVGDAVAWQLMAAIGVLDVIVALWVVIRPGKWVLSWMVFWAFATALMRPLTGQSIWAFVERSGNFGAPLALLLLKAGEKKSV